MMTNSFIHAFRKNVFLIGGLLWILLWLLPWTTWLHSLPWIRLGISFIIFATPGMGISLLLMGERLNLSTHFTSGLAFSVLLVGSLGFLARIFNLPFRSIPPIFALTGLITFVILFIQFPLGQRLHRPLSFSITTLVLLMFMLGFGVIINFQSKIGGDDLSYLAHLTNWQYAQPLTFQEVVFGSGDLDPIRFWLAMLPMSWAFLAEISNLHGISLLGIYLEPYLLLFGLLAFYNLCEDFLKNERLAIAATLLQFTFFVLLQELRQPGSTFFFRLSEDKAFAAFILAPVFFLAMRHFLSSFTLRNGAFAFLSGLSLTVTHPVILAYSLIIASLYVSVICIITERNFKKFSICMLLLIIIVLPAMSLRFIDGPLTSRFVVNLQSAIDAYSEESGGRFSYIEGTPFYGFDLERLKIKITEPNQETPLQTFFSWSCLWLVIIGFLWSLFNLKKKATAPFVFATTALVLLCGIPYTGWLIGYLVSAGMLWRAPWLLPIGLISVVLITEVVQAVSHKIAARIEPNPVRERALLWLFSGICIVLMAYSSIPRYNAMKRAILSRDTYINRLERLSRLGNHLENNLEQASVFVAPTDIMSFLPGLSSKADIIFFRTRNFTPHPVDPAKLKLIFSPDTSIQMRRRMNVLKRYQIQYVLITDPGLMDYYANYTKYFNVEKANGFWILELRESNS